MVGVYVRLVLCLKLVQHEAGQRSGGRDGITDELVVLHRESASQIRPNERCWLAVTQTESGQDRGVKCLVGKPHCDKHGSVRWAHTHTHAGSKCHGLVLVGRHDRRSSTNRSDGEDLSKRNEN